MGVFSAFAQMIPMENAGFEGEYVLQSGQKELKVARGWHCWWVHGPQAADGWLVRPEFYPKGFGPLWDPKQDQAQGIQSTYSTHQGGVVQAVQLPSGARELHVEVLARIYSRHNDGSGGALGTRVGLDPTGQVQDGTASTIAWGSWQSQDGGWDGREWRTLAAHLPYAHGGVVSIWLESRNRWKARDNHTWWNQASLTYEADSSPGPGPGPIELPADIEEAIAFIRAALGSLDTRLTQVEARLESGFAGVSDGLDEVLTILNGERRDPELQKEIEKGARVWDPVTEEWITSDHE